MNIKGTVKVLGDPYGGFYSCGLTMYGSETMNRFQTVSEDAEETIMTSDHGLRLTIFHRENEQGAIEVQTVVENTSSNPITLELLTSFVLNEVTADRIHRIRSFWSAEGRMKTDTIEDLNLEYAWNHMAYRIEKFGTVGTMPVRSYFPFLALEDSKTGHITAIQLYSPSSWQMEIITQKDARLTVTGGIADRDFGQWLKTLKPGEVLVAPKAVIAEGENLYDACDKLVKSQKPSYSPIDNQMGIVFNEYCTTWGNPTEENLKNICDKIADLGIQYLVMDSGWYGSGEGYWWDEIGSWNINQTRFPNGLKPVADYIRSKGMIPGIWFELEVVTKAVDKFHEMEYLVQKDGMPLQVADRRFFDMESEKVDQYLTEKVINRLRDDGFGYIKVDYNDTMGMGCDGSEGMGENLRQKMLGTQRFFRKMQQELPDLVIENCSSGGHRLEPSMMELASMASFSDAHETQSIPLIAANLHRVIAPRQNQIWAVIRKEHDCRKLEALMIGTCLGRMGLSGDIFDLSIEQWQTIKEGIAFYQVAAHIIEKGKTTCILSEPKSYNNPVGGQLVLRTLGDETLVIYHRFKDSVSIEEFMNQHDIKVDGSVCQSYGRADADFGAIAKIIRK